MNSVSRNDAVVRASEPFLRSVFQLVRSPVSIVRTSDGTLLDVNREWSLLTGYSAEEAIGRSVDELRLWRPGGMPAFWEMRTDEESLHEGESSVRTKSDDVRHIRWSAHEVDLAGQRCAVIVMNELRASTEMHEASEVHVRLMADSAPVLMWVADQRARRTYFNQPWREFTGRPIEDHLSDRWVVSIHPSDRESVREAGRRAFSRREAFSVEYRLRRHDGEYRWMLDRAAPMYRADGVFAGFVGSCLEIHEQKETERSLREAKEHAEEIARLKSGFLATLTHEIRTPLTVILGFTTVLRQGVRADYHRFIDLVERSGRRLLLMLDSMLDLAQLEAGTLEINPRSQNIVDVVEGVAATLAPVAAEKGLSFHVSSEAERCYADVDHTVLVRVLNNMIDNSIKFTDEGRIDVHVAREEDRVTIKICDTGVGIDRRFLAHVFDPFVQESSGMARSHQGTGVGLAASKRLLERMDGTVTVQSTKGEGTVFTIFLPIRT